MIAVESRVGIVTAVLFGVGVAAGCGGNTASSRPPVARASAGADEYASGLTEHHRYHHGGVTLFIAMSLDTLGVAPEQQSAVDKIRSELRSAMAPERTAEEGLLATLADGLSGPKLDAASVDAAVAQVAKAAAAVQDASVEALNQLHPLLTLPERAALVDKVEAHWAIWQKENAEELAASNNTQSGHLATLTTELDLTADQVDKHPSGPGGRYEGGAANQSGGDCCARPRVWRCLSGRDLRRPASYHGERCEYGSDRVGGRAPRSHIVKPWPPCSPPTNVPRSRASSENTQLTPRVSRGTHEHSQPDRMPPKDSLRFCSRGNHRCHARMRTGNRSCMAVVTATSRRMRTSARRNPFISTVVPTIGTAVAGTTVRAAAGTVTTGSRPRSINVACRVL